MNRSTTSPDVASAVLRSPVGALPTFEGLRVTVIGDAILDSYLEGSPREVCREAPVPVIDQSREVFSAGGAANVAVNVASLGAQCTYACALGADREGEALEQVLVSAGVSLWPAVVCDGRTTVSKRRVVADGQTLVRVDRGDPAALHGRDRRTFLKSVELAVRAADVVVVSDYRYGLVDEELLQTVRRAVCEATVVAGDSRKPALLASLACDVIKPNRAEAAALLGIGPDVVDAELVEDRAHDLMQSTNAQLVAVTLDSEGAVIVGEDLHSPLRSAAHAWRRPHPAGAGDSYLAAFALTLAATGSAEQASEAASAAAGVVVRQERTVACTRRDLDEALEVSSGRAQALSKIVTEDELMLRVLGSRDRGERIVFTNGCFDLLHSGHADLLARARALGDLLVVAVNDDEGVRTIKGDARPVMRLNERAAMLAALSSVDLVVSFSEPTAEHLVRLVRPDIYARGDDGEARSVPEAAAARAIGADVRLLPRVIELSTSSVLSRMRSMPVEVSTA